MAQKSEKQQQIDKTMDNMYTIAATAVFVTVFSLFSAHSLWQKLIYQNHVISASTTARNQLNDDLSAAQKLTSSYENFNQASVNLLGAQVSGPDNDNAKIVLDALPSSYDYPALLTSLEALLSNQGVTIDSIGGTDNGATQGSGATASAPASSTTAVSTSTSSKATASPSSDTSVAMPYTFSVNGPYQNIQNVISEFEKSTRPFQILSMTLSGDQSNITLTVNGQAFYQPATKFNITQETVK